MQVGQGNAWRVPAGRWQACVVVLAALCLSLLAALFAQRGESRVEPAPTALASVDLLARPSASAPASQDVAQAVGETPARAVLPDRVATWRRDFDTSIDLFDFAQRLLPEVADGEPEATWLLSRVIDECAGYAADPAAFARDSAVLAGMGLPAARAMQVARARVGTRCGRFGPGDDLSHAREHRLRWQAARAGGLAAEAELLARGQPLSADAGYSDGLLERVVRAGDAQAFGALSAAGEVPGWLSMLDQNVAPQYAPLVWQLVACRMGMDCGPQSPVVTSYCVNGGICSRLPEQGFEEFVYDAAVPRQSAEIVRSAVSALMEGFGG